jgi:putative drug exporter of the RND superfamily
MLGKLDDIATVRPAAFNQSGDVALIGVIPKSSPTSQDTIDLVSAIRDHSATSHRDTGADLMVTGTTAVDIGVSAKLGDAMVPYLAIVVGLALILLLLVFRSILVPLKAALGFLLSVLATLGVLVAVFQWGWLKDVFGVDQTAPIVSVLPILLIGVVFGLAMDYEVFLVTRMREEYVHGADPTEAVVAGFRHGARVVTAAAIIRAWALPAWLDRIMPNVDVEGEKLRHVLEARREGTGGSTGDEQEPAPSTPIRQG